MVKETRSKPGRVGDGTPGPGRPKGSKNKLGAAAKDAFQGAFDELGGQRGLVAWAKADEKNLGEFYKLYARLIPLEHSGPDGGPIEVQMSDRDRARRVAFLLAKGMRSKA